MTKKKALGEIRFIFGRRHLASEQVAESAYQLGQCQKSYPMVVLRKNLSIERGEDVLFDEIRFCFYISNRRDLTRQEIVQDANERCNQKNVVAVLKSGSMRCGVRSTI